MQVMLIVFIVICSFGAGWNFANAYYKKKFDDDLRRTFEYMFIESRDITEKFVNEVDRLSEKIRKEAE